MLSSVLSQNHGLSLSFKTSFANAHFGHVALLRIASLFFYNIKHHSRITSGWYWLDFSHVWGCRLRDLPVIVCVCELVLILHFLRNLRPFSIYTFSMMLWVFFTVIMLLLHLVSKLRGRLILVGLLYWNCVCCHEWREDHRVKFRHVDDWLCDLLLDNLWLYGLQLTDLRRHYFRRHYFRWHYFRRHRLRLYHL